MQYGFRCDQSDQLSQQDPLRETPLRPWSGRVPHQGLETLFRLRPHILLETERQPDAANAPPLRQPDAANAPPLRQLAVVEVASHLPETLVVAASAVRYTQIESDQDRNNYRREEDLDHHVAARVMSTVHIKVCSSSYSRHLHHLTSQGMMYLSRPDHSEPQTPNNITTSVDIDTQNQAQVGEHVGMVAM